MYAVIDLETRTLVRVVASGRNLVTAAGGAISQASLLSREDLLSKGVIPITDPGQPDPALFRVTGQRVVIEWPNAAFVYDAEPIPAAEVRTNAIAAIKAHAAALLTPTDWLAIRASETAAPIPVEITAYRAAVRAASNEAEDAIATVGDDTAAILAVIPEWPTQP